MLNNPDFVLGAGSDGAVLWAAFLELFAGLTCIGTAVVLYRVIRRDRESAAMGFVAASLVTTARSLVAVHDWTFLFGPGFLPVVNALCLATALLGALPIAAWEFSLGVWLTFKGFTPSAITDEPARSATPPAYDHVAA